MGANSQIPWVRFKGFASAWEEQRLGDNVGVTSASRVHKKDWRSDGVPFFRTSDVISAYKGKDNDKAYISTELYEELAEASGKVSKGDLLVTGGGSVGVPYVVKNDCPLYFKDADLLWLKSANVFDSTFLYTFFESKVFRKYLASISHIGTIAHYTIEQCKDTPVSFPSHEEQTQIGTLFECLGSMIDLHRREVVKLRQVKQAMLVKMFPTVAADMPEIRFPGFSGAWERRRLGASADFSKGSGYSKSDLAESGRPIILYGRMYTKYELSISSVDTFAAMKPGSVLSTGNEVIVPASGETSEDIARASAVMLEGVILGGDLNIIRPHNDLLSQFLALHLSNGMTQTELATRAQGKSIVHLHGADFQDVPIMVPSPPEQAQISAFFSRLDALITFQELKGEKLVQVKRSLLSKMFV